MRVRLSSSCWNMHTHPWAKLSAFNAGGARLRLPPGREEERSCARGAEDFADGDGFYTPVAARFT